MKIYVAGASKDLARIDRIYKALREKGHTITCDWVSVVRAAGSANEGETLSLRAAAEEDLRGVDRAEVFFFAGPAVGSCGAWFEFGYAYRSWIVLRDSRVRIILVGDCPSVFAHLADLEKFPDDKSALASL
jgi:hypothetical protein